METNFKVDMEDMKWILIEEYVFVDFDKYTTYLTYMQSKFWDVKITFSGIFKQITIIMLIGMLKTLMNNIIFTKCFYDKNNVFKQQI